jgi:polyhydroxybutyrate depolymerase
VDDWRCTSGIACETDTDDVAYFEALIDDVSSRVQIDADRIFVTGLSNGGAMSFRLACELPRIRGAAPIGGAMQFTTGAECKPSDPRPILYVHGTTDPCWRYEGGEPNCPTGQSGKKHISAQRTINEWKTIAGCRPEPLMTDAWRDGVNDDITTQLQQFQGCFSEFTHLKVEGGGHTWPNGHAYLGEMTIGPVSRDWGNEVLLDFFDRH